MFEPSLLNACYNFDAYKREVQRTPPHHRFSEDQLQEGWSLHNRDFKKQVQLQTRLQSPGVFKAALARSPNLHVVRLQTGSCDIISWTNHDTAGIRFENPF